MDLEVFGRCELFAEDDNFAVYQYGGENPNFIGPTRGNLYDLDGIFCINKRCLPLPLNKPTTFEQTCFQPQIQYKRRFDFNSMVTRGDILITKPCISESALWNTPDTPTMFFAKNLISKIFDDYLSSGKLPDSCSFYMDIPDTTLD